MRLPKMALLMLLSALLLGACARAPSSPTATPASPTPAPPTATPTPPPPPTPEGSHEPHLLSTGGVWLEVAAGSEARYRVREQLARLNFPSDAVGTTQQVSGTLRLDPSTLAILEGSKFTVDLRTLRSDESRRDQYIQRNTLETHLYPYAEFIPHQVIGLTGPLPTQGEARFQVAGDMTIHGVTRPITWEVEATFSESGVRGQARTAFKFGDFGMTIPRVMAVLSVEDNIRLELDFVLERKGGP
ncbi:Protein YceI [bacterium HR23]|nr:Protein YceI [bacterium HR23]